jgi:hypothetical protein
MNSTTAVISGHKVEEDDLTRWSVFCYVCRDLFGEPSVNAEDLKETLAEHLALHE